MRFNIPNILTLVRISLAPVFVVAFYIPVQWNYVLATVIFVVAALTDMLDGYFARRLGQVSPFGAFLDPVADKLMVAVALVLLVERYPSLWLVLPAIVIIGREITVSALREWMAEVGSAGKVSVSVPGKVKTVLQMVALSCLIWGHSLYTIGLVLLYCAVLLTLWSMWQYLRNAWPDMRA